MRPPCHALRVRSSGPADPAPLAAALGVGVPGRIWEVELPVGATHPVAGRARAAELSRAAVRPRCVLVRYADGQSDLVLVAPREDAPEPGDADPPSWGLGARRSTTTGTHHVVLAAQDGGDPESWQRALACTLRHYDPEGTSATAVGLLFDPVFPALPDVEYVPCLEPVYPLTLSVGVDELRCDFRESHFRAAAVEQFARHLVHVHRQLRQAPEIEPPLLSEAERDRIARLGGSSAGAAPPVRLDVAFGEVAAATPDAVAVCDNEVRLTYRELDRKADAVAAGLRGLGVGGGDLVVLCLERSAELVVVLLGVLKAGAAYVPVDPAYPADRLSYTAKDADARVVVTRLAEFPCGAGTTSVTPDDLLAEPPSTPSVPSVAGTPDDPAYVIYTSGSTGRPKGVVVAHRNVCGLIDATRDEYELGRQDVWTLFHSSAFDFSTWEIWGCLLTGGRLVVVSYADSRDPERFRDLLVAQGVTVLSQTPSAFAQLLAVAHADVAVRLVVFGGEPLDPRVLLGWFDRHPESRCRVVNMFGITETTVHVTAQTVDRTLAIEGSRSVGPALPGWRVYVLDPDGQLAPPGVAGEIYVGGVGVALGYLNRPELTAQRFLPDPFAGGVLYRSGDLGRLLPDGALEHLGRIDSQVKIRGFRIELDEIRAVLVEDPDVRAAAVVVRRDDPADPAKARLDAYVVPAGLDTGRVRKHVAGILPEHMVPATISAVPELPLTVNGKLDVARLPAPESSTVEVEAEPGAHGELVEAMRQVWSEVFGAEVGPDDDFYRLGGNSLLAVRIRIAMRDKGLPEPKLRDMLRHPTIRALASVAGGHRDQDAG